MNETAGVRVRDFGCGDLHTVASAGFASVHYYRRDVAHPHSRVEHAYPSHSLVFTDVGEWQYHGTAKPATITQDVLVLGIGRRQYACAHPDGFANECFIVALCDAAFEDDGADLFSAPEVRVTPEMQAHRRAIVRAVCENDDPERIESLAFSLYDIVSRASTKATRVPAADIRMSYARKLIRDRCSSRVSIAELARELDLSRFTFTRRFRAAAGMTPHQFLTAMRIERAKDGLSRTCRSIEEVGLANGFGSIAHFSHTFRAIVGCAPSAYRAMTSSRAVSNADG